MISNVNPTDIFVLEVLVFLRKRANSYTKCTWSKKNWNRKLWRTEAKFYYWPESQRTQNRMHSTCEISINKCRKSVCRLQGSHTKFIEPIKGDHILNHISNKVHGSVENGWQDDYLKLLMYYKMPIYRKLMPLTCTAPYRYQTLWLIPKTYSMCECIMAEHSKTWNLYKNLDNTIESNGITS